MSNLVVIQEGDLIQKDAADSKVYVYDWDAANLAPTVQLSTSVFTITERDPYDAWSATVAYVVNDQVVLGSAIYLCMLDHTNQTPPNATYWTAIGTFTALTKDSEARLTAAEATTALQRTVTVDNRVTRLRLIGGTLGQQYDIANKVTITETPSQIKERSFRILIEDR
jgi:hypothetical protein